MAKGQKRSNRELKKPKAKKPAAPATKQRSTQGGLMTALSLFNKRT